jgi:tRNA modification GTPase
MANLIEEDTIVAIASAPGRGAIACLRVSGTEAYPAVEQLLEAGKTLETFAPHTIQLAWLVDRDGRRLDQAMVVRYPAPHSYTGEDVVEIFCHGGKWAPRLIVENLCHAGCRIAEPGEFTRRAFFNRKLDLIQAEAIEDIVAAESPAGLQNALHHLEGHFSEKLQQLRQKLVRSCALLELGLDFSEEDVEFADRAQLAAELDELEKEIRFLLSGFQRGQAIKEGWRVAIIGKPNVGKSSLMNVLLRDDRVIVSAQPGTTRDTVEDSLVLEGQRFRLVDTAGIRHSKDEVERAGVARSRRAAEQAHIILFLSDRSQPAEDLDYTIAAECARYTGQAGTEGAMPAKNILHIRNKSDLPKASNTVQLSFPVDAELETSATTGAGIRELEKKLCALTGHEGQARAGEIVLTNLRHQQGLEKALAALIQARQSLETNLSAEFVATDLREVLHQIGILVGEVTTEDILGEIFAHFCIGK